VSGVFDSRGSVGFYPTFRIGNGTATNYFRPVNGVLTLTSVAPTRANNPEYYLNANEFVVGLTRSNRLNWSTSVEFDITDRVTTFADFTYYKADSMTGRAPNAINAPTNDKYGVMSIDNPFNPYGSRFYHVTGAPNADGSPRLTGEPRTVTILSELVKDVPPERAYVDSELFRAVAGLRGKIADNWNWEAGALYSRATVTDDSPNSVRESLLLDALMRTDSTAFNPFGSTFKVQGGQVVADQPYTNPDSVLSTFVRSYIRNGMSSIASIDARASGPVYTIWGGDIALAVGGEYRIERWSDARGPFAGQNPPGSGLDPNDNDFLLLGLRPDANGKRNVASYYLESVIPLASARNDFPLVKLLEITASIRHERYNDFGNVTKPKVGVSWRPFSTVMLRGSISEGFTAPNLPTLHAPTVIVGGAAPGTFDPYRNPVTNEGQYIMQGIISGNTALKPVQSKGASAGIVLDVPGVRGLSFTADYWEIDQTDVITTRNANDIRLTDAALLQAYTKQQLAAGVPVGSIDLGSGTAAYKGDPNVVRYPPTAADIAVFAAYNAANPGNQMAVAGQILSTSTPPLNLADGHVSGWDLGVSYLTPELSVGRISINSDWTYVLDSYTSQDNLVNNRLEVDGNSRWRGTTTITWRKGRWTGILGGYYIGPFADRGATTTAAVYESLGRPSYIAEQFDGGRYLYRYMVEDSLTFNASLGYRFGSDASRWLRNLSVRVGVVNIQDKEPPLATGGFGYPTAVYGNLLIGRTYTLDLTKTF